MEIKITKRLYNLVNLFFQACSPLPSRPSYIRFLEEKSVILLQFHPYKELYNDHNSFFLIPISLQTDGITL